MNETPTPRPRFSCRLVRLWSTDTATGLMGSHVEACADCRQFFRAAAGLESALRRDAARCAPPVPTDLERRIVQAIRAAAPTPAPAPFHLSWFAGAGVAAAAAIALAVVLLRPSPQVAPPDAGMTPGVSEVVVSDGSISSQLGNAVIDALAADNPLQQEINSVYSDARSALDFLALNFLPSSAVGNALPRAEQLGAKG